jgi:hypothetical protein
MKFITLVPFMFLVYMAALLFFYYAFGLGGLVIAVLAAVVIMTF